jgi:hypothetical protein
VSVLLAAMLGTLGVVMVAGPAWADPKRDFNGDGRGDLLALYDYGNGSTGLWVFPGAPTQPNGLPGLTGSYMAWETPPGSYWISVTKNVAGDFNGDGRTDIMSLYDYGNGEAGLFIIPGTGGSGPNATDAYRVWWSPPGNFWPSVVKVAAGDVNGDGKDDLLAMYNYPDNSYGIFVFPGTASVGDGSSNPYMTWQSQPYWNSLSEVEFAAGDVNGDGRDDLVIGAEANGHVKVFSGVDNSELRSFFAFPGFLGSARVAARDVNGDGAFDLVVGFGPGGNGLVRTFDGLTLALLSERTIADPLNLGVFVA